MAVLCSLQPGEVVSYGDVAAEAGFPGAARGVGAVLSASGHEVAWWRVVTAAGRLVPGREAEQARRLRAEGVTLRGGRVAPGDQRGRAALDERGSRAARHARDGGRRSRRLLAMDEQPPHHAQEGR